MVYDDYKYYLYLYNTDEIDSDWKDFIPLELQQGSNFTQQRLSLVIFVVADSNIYSVIGGSAYQIIVPYIDHSFGLNMYARIMKPDQDELFSMKSRKITGNKAASSEQFRGSFRIINFARFGKIPKEIHIKLSQEITDLHFGFLKTIETERLQVSVAKGFKIKRDIDFTQLHRIIGELQVISELAPSEQLSSYQEIVDKEFIGQELYPRLINAIWNDIEFIGRDRQNLHGRFEFDFCNPNNIEEFYEADEYSLREKTENGGYATFETLTDRTSIYDAILVRAAGMYGNNFVNFRAYIQGLRVVAYKNGKKKAASTFLFHISSEFSVNGQPYFLVDTKWYLLRPTFLTDLRSGAEHVLRTNSAPSSLLIHPWNKSNIRTEREYNQQYSGLTGYLVLDTIIVDGLELCDIICIREDATYLVHVKYGFDSKIRELSNQILISARRLKDTLGTGDTVYFEKIYAQLHTKGLVPNGLSILNFIELFKQKIVYVLAFTSQLPVDLEVRTNIDSYSSNIARFSLVQCASEMRSDYYELVTCQIRRTNDTYNND